MTRQESQIPPPSTLNACNVVDWIEAVMFIENRDLLSRALIRRMLTRLLHFQKEKADVDDNKYREGGVDFYVDLIPSEVNRRRKAANNAYPFEWQDGRLCRRTVSNGEVYEFVLLLAVSQAYREERRFKEIEVLFDNVVTQAVKLYLGPGSKGVRFGSPASGGRPTAFPDAVAWLAKQLGLGIGPEPPRTEVRDGGLDVVGWRPFRDGRPGFITILCQCTVRKDWVDKAKDVVVGKWRGWIDFGLDPVTAVAVPFVLPQTFNKWGELLRTVNIVFDRMRLFDVIQLGGVEDQELIRAWNEKERSCLTA